MSRCRWAICCPPRCPYENTHVPRDNDNSIALTTSFLKQYRGHESHHFSRCFLRPGVGSEVPERSVCVSLTTKRLPIDRIKTYTIKEGSMRAVM